MIEMLKNRLAIIASVVTIIVTLGGSAYAVDQRYMKVSDYEAAQQRYEVRQIEDQLFKLDFTIAEDAENAKPLDRALRERYKERLDTIRK